MQEQSKEKKSSFPLYLTLVMPSAMLVALFILITFSGAQSSKSFRPLINAVIEVKFQATNIHLWFAETVQGKKDKKTMSDFWKLFSHASSHIKIIQKGDAEGTEMPLPDPDVTRQVNEISRRLAAYRKITEERFGTWQNKTTRQKMEEQYTAAFFRLIEQINNVHLLLESKSTQRRSRFHSAMYAQFAIILILFVLIALTFRKYENERNSRLAQIEDARKRASRSEEDLRSHKGKLLEANRELKTTMAELTSLNEKMEVQSSAMVKVNRELERNEAMLKSIFRVAPTGIGMTRDRVIEMTNEAIHRMTGYAEEELQGKGERFLYPDGEEFEYANRERYQQIDKYGTGTAITRWLRKDGIVIDVLLSSTPLDKNNLKAGVIFTALDITVQMESEKKIKGSLKEKEILLREIHHRVKNNLQVISSLLNLQAKYISDDKYREYFNDSQRRVRSMAIVHDRLYQSKDLEKVNFSEFIKILIHELLNVFRKNSSVIHVNYNIDEIYFGVDEAIPCALIINELVTNSLKYAFPGERGGEINIDFLKTDNGVYTLRIKDNGIGLPGGFSFDDTKSFGLGMVNILSSQLRGQVKYNSSQGTEFIVTFSYEEGSERKGRF